METRLLGASRRQFLKEFGAALAGPLLLPSNVLGGAGKTAANNRIGVGMIGVGNQGTVHTKVLLGIPDVQVVAVCDPVQSKRRAARRRVEEFYAASHGSASYEGCADFNDFRELLARPEVDAVFISSPEHWHALQTIAAARAGKDIYCEKAMAVTIAQSQAMVRAVRKHQRIFQLGTQQRSSARFRFACELARNGYLGRLHTIKVGDPKGYPGPAVKEMAVPEGLDYDLWLGPAPCKPYFPERIENLKGWMLAYDYTVGFQSGWGQHEIDIAQWGNGTDHTGPVSVEGHATFPSSGLNDTAMTWHTEFTYGSGVKLIFTSDNENPHGIRFEGSEGWVFVNREKLEAHPASLLTAKLASKDTPLYRSDHHHLDFIRCIRTRRDPICPVEAGHRTYTICNLSDLATRLRRPLKWNPEIERCELDEEANQRLDRPMRAPWNIKT